MRLGIEKTAMIRARAGIGYALAEAMDEGHCGLPRTSCVTLAADCCWRSRPRSSRRRSSWSCADGRGGRPTRSTASALRLPGRAASRRAEQAIAERLRALCRDGSPLAGHRCRQGDPLGRAAKAGITLAESQREAVRLACASKVLVITGGPGVGKTTLVNTILKILAARASGIALAAPTGRAAKRMSEATGLEAKTIHRLLEADPARAASSATRSTRSTATCWSWTRPRWSTCR